MIFGFWIQHIRGYINSHYIWMCRSIRNLESHRYLFYTMQIVHNINDDEYHAHVCNFMQAVGCCNHQSLDWAKSEV